MPVLDQTHPEIIELTCCFPEFVLAENQVIPSFCSKDIAHLEILQSDLPRAFWPISKEPDFSQTWDFCRGIANNINFHYRTKSKKIMTKFFNKSKKLYFLPIF